MKSSHFNTREFRCRCCERLLIDYRLIVALEKLRLDLGLPLIINSGYRCPEHNEAIGGVKKSGHTKGYSADIRTPQGMDTIAFGRKVWNYRKTYGIKRVGLYNGYQNKKGFCHFGIKKHPFAPDRWGDW
jgi:uncharacterized protein YcbK (DUF882 family)